MNTIHSRGGNQVVFSSINYGTDTSAEGRCIIREILNTTYEGVGNGSTAIFPIQIWKKIGAFPISRATATTTCTSSPAR